MTRLCFAVLSIIAISSAAEAPKKRSPERTTMTGCVDQNGEQFVLTGDRELKEKAKLKGRAFSDANFARHVGHKVKVEGTSTKQGEEVVFEVDRISTVSETCSDR